MAADIFKGLSLLLDAHPLPPASGLARCLFLPPETLPPAAGRLREAGYHLEDLSGLDCAEGILVTYHFNHFEISGRIALRVPVPHEGGRVASIALIFGGAEWHERELSDFFGVTFEGSPNPSPLLLPAENRSMPLRKKQEQRRGLRELMDPGVIVYQAPGFDWFKPEEPPPPPEGGGAP
jgi:NADH-quinone oxidoreductase subunit C